MSTKTETKTVTETKVAADDLDDVIELAAQMMQAEEGALSDEEVKEIATELDIPEEYIDRARKQLEVKRALELKVAKQAAAKKKWIMIGSGAAVGFVVLLVGVSTSNLSSLHSKVEAQAAQVKNVKERQVSVQKTLASRPDSADKDAELIGAENRVRVETKRYNDVVQDYNEKAGGVFGSFSVMFSSLPRQVTPQ